MRRAVEARDQGWRWPGCQAPDGGEPPSDPPAGWGRPTDDDGTPLPF